MSEVPDSFAGELDAVRAARRRRVVWAFVGAAVVIIGVSVPVGFIARGNTTERVRPAEQPLPAVQPTTPVLVSPVAPRSTTPVTTSRPTTPTTPLPLTTASDELVPPPGLSAPERDLWNKMAMDGVNFDSCLGYPPGE